MRFFAAWYPTALLPRQGVRWEAVDDRSARATLEEGDVTLTPEAGRADQSREDGPCHHQSRRRVEGRAVGAEQIRRARLLE